MDDLDEIRWLYRGVPHASSEVQDVLATGEVRPPRADRVGESWRMRHIHGDTETGYTSWTTDRSIAEAAAEESSRQLDGPIVIFRVFIDTPSFDRNRIYPGRDDEEEWLIEGRVEEVSISESADEEEKDENDEW